MSLNPSVILAIETSQHVGGVALRGADRSIHVEMLSPQKRHDDDLLPAIDRLFARLNLAPRDLSAVGVSIGPGGFTGLRIAVSTAKMFAEALGAKLIAVPTALVAAESCSEQGPIMVALASKNESAWFTALRRVGGVWAIQIAPGLADAATLNLMGIQALLADEYLPTTIRTLCEQSNVQVIDPMFDPRSCLAIAERMLKAGEMTDALSLQPLYPRQPEAVTIWEQRMKRK